MPPSVSGLFHSSRQVPAQPTASSAAVISSTSLVYTLNLRKERFRAMFSHTRKPRPPMMINADSVRSTTGSALNSIRLCPGAMAPKMSKPALQNAETE